MKSAFPYSAQSQMWLSSGSGERLHGYTDHRYVQVTTLRSVLRRPRTRMRRRECSVLQSRTNTSLRLFAYGSDRSRAHCCTGRAAEGAQRPVNGRTAREKRNALKAEIRATNLAPRPLHRSFGLWEQASQNRIVRANQQRYRTYLRARESAAWKAKFFLVQ